MAPRPAGAATAQARPAGSRLDPSDERRLRAWRRAIGPVRAVSPDAQAEPDAAPREGPVRLTAATWNAQVGGGALGELWDTLEEEARAHGGALALLLQEVFVQEGAPRSPPPDASWAQAIAPVTGKLRAKRDIATFAKARGLHLIYAPSMRNGGPGDPPEDRGNALLANRPLLRPRIIELPFERQRRAAVAAAIRIQGATFRLCSVHLDNRAPWRKAWRSLGAGRRRQMEHLLAEYPEGAGGPFEAHILGGDFNTWYRGAREPAFRLARRAFPSPRKLDPRGTHHFEIGGWLRRSDYLLHRLPEGWRATCRRLSSTFGSDHYPIASVVTTNILPGRGRSEAPNPRAWTRPCPTEIRSGPQPTSGSANP